MATHSNILAWRIPWTGKPGRVAKNNIYSTSSFFLSQLLCLHTKRYGEQTILYKINKLLF